MIKSVNFNEIEALYAAATMSRFIIESKLLIEEMKTHIPENADKAVFLV